MIRRLLVALACLAAPLAHAVAPARPAPTHREGELLVKYRDHARSRASERLRRDLGLVSLRSLLDGRAELLALPSVLTTRGALELLRADPAVEFAEPNFVRRPRQAAPNDPLFPELWGLHSTGQPNYLSSDPALASIPGADMDMLAAWDDPAAEGPFDRVGDGTAVVAVIDDSVATTHEDLKDNIVAGFDFVRNDDDPRPDPGTDQFHGTLVAGCVGAVGHNDLGVAGTAWNVKLMPLKFAFDTAGFVAAMEFARANGAHIVNASFGGPGYSQAEVNAIAAAAADGILFVAAGGNDDSNTDVAELNYPANYDLDNIVSVAATNRQDNIASFSQYGPVTTDVAAPGLQIVTTANTGYATNPGIGGTSFAAPYTAGIAALLRMEVPASSYHEVIARLVEGAEPGGDATRPGNASRRTAAGRVNARNSLELAPRPALVIRDVQWVDANGARDSGETTQVDITVANLWQDATNVQGTLSADHGVTVTGGAVDFGTLTPQATVTRSFEVMVPAGIIDHRYVTFTLALIADGSYEASRNFMAEIGDLGDAVVTQAFASLDQDLYDEFHAWHYDFAGLPPGDTQLVIRTTAPADIDLLVKKDVPPQYNITVGIDNPETPGFFCTSGTTPNCQDPATFIDADADGNEAVVIDNPLPGTYHIVIVNFARRQLDTGLVYSLQAFTRPAAPPPSGGGGGAPAPLLLLGLLALRVARPRPRA